MDTGGQKELDAAQARLEASRLEQEARKAQMALEMARKELGEAREEPREEARMEAHTRDQKARAEARASMLRRFEQSQSNKRERDGERDREHHRQQMGHGQFGAGLERDVDVKPASELVSFILVEYECKQSDDALDFATGKFRDVRITFSGNTNNARFVHMLNNVAGQFPGLEVLKITGGSNHVEQGFDLRSQQSVDMRKFGFAVNVRKLHRNQMSIEYVEARGYVPRFQNEIHIWVDDVQCQSKLKRSFDHLSNHEMNVHKKLFDVVRDGSDAPFSFTQLDIQLEKFLGDTYSLFSSYKEEDLVVGQHELASDGLFEEMIGYRLGSAQI
jgi:hypothetical protein